MAELSYSEYAHLSSKRGDSSQGNSSAVSYFYLADDNDEAVVRFNVSSVDDLKVYSVHRIKVNNRDRYISCIKDFTNPEITCPLCEKGEKLYYKIYVTMIRYDVDGSKIEPVPVVWERPTAFFDKLKKYVDNYGDLRNQLFKIIRNGKKGDTNTSYEIIPLGNGSLVFNDENCPADFSVFDDYKIKGGIIMERTAEDINVFLSTGNFPNPFKKEEKPAQQTQAQVSHTMDRFSGNNTRPMNQVSNLTQPKEESEQATTTQGPRRYTY